MFQFDQVKAQPNRQLAWNPQIFGHACDYGMKWLSRSLKVCTFLRPAKNGRVKELRLFLPEVSWIILKTNFPGKLPVQTKLILGTNIGLHGFLQKTSTGVLQCGFWPSLSLLENMFNLIQWFTPLKHMREIKRKLAFLREPEQAISDWIFVLADDLSFLFLFGNNS